MSKTRASRRRPKHLLCVGSPPFRRTHPPVTYSSSVAPLGESSSHLQVSYRVSPVASFYRFPRTLVDAHHSLGLVLYCTSCELFSANLVYHRTLRAYDTHAPANPPPVVVVCIFLGSWGMVSVFGCSSRGDTKQSMCLHMWTCLRYIPRASAFRICGPSLDTADMLSEAVSFFARILVCKHGRRASALPVCVCRPITCNL